MFEHGLVGVWWVAVRTPLAVLLMVLVGPVQAAGHYQWIYIAPVEVAERSAFRIQRVWYVLCILPLVSERVVCVVLSNLGF